MYQKDPRVSHNDAVASLQKIIDDFNPMNLEELPDLEPVETIAPKPIPIDEKRIFILDSFSDDNEDVTVSNDKRSVTSSWNYGYCFINHPRNDKKTILQWTLRVPKCGYGFIGTVTFLAGNIIFYFLKSTFKRFWYSSQATE